MLNFVLYLATWMVLGLGMVVGGIVGVVVAVCIGPIQLLPLSVGLIITGVAILGGISSKELEREKSEV